MIGIDAKIETLRARFAAKLFSDITGNTYTSYGRAFLNKRKDDKGSVYDVPEVLIENTNKYQEVLPDRKKDGISFFIVEPEREGLGGDNFKSKVSIYFAANLKILYPSVTERAVEYLHKDVIKQINNYSFDVTGIVTGLESFERFGFVKETDNMQPFYLVRFDTETNYNINEC